MCNAILPHEYGTLLLAQATLLRAAAEGQEMRLLNRQAEQVTRQFERLERTDPVETERLRERWLEVCRQVDRAPEMLRAAATILAEAGRAAMLAHQNTEPGPPV